MGIAEEKLAQAEHLQGMMDSLRESAKLRVRIAERGAPFLWEMLQTGIEKEVATFAAKCTRANTLVAYRDGNRMTVRTQHFPVVKLELTRSDGWVTIKSTGVKCGTAPEETLLHNMYEFSADQELRPCFADYTLSLHPDEIVRKALEPVFDFLIS